MARTFSQPSDGARAAVLIDREELLAEEARHLPGGSYRRRCQIEEELSQILRQLKRLGHERVARLLERQLVLEAVARDLPPGTRRDNVLTELDGLRTLIETLKCR